MDYVLSEMKNIQRFALFGLSLLALVIATSLVNDPYTKEKVASAQVLAAQCDTFAISYLADYFEKRADQSEIRNLLGLKEKCEKEKLKEVAQ